MKQIPRKEQSMTQLTLSDHARKIEMSFIQQLLPGTSSRSASKKIVIPTSTAPAKAPQTPTSSHHSMAVAVRPLKLETYSCSACTQIFHTTKVYAMRVACALRFCLQRPSFAIDTHTQRLYAELSPRESDFTASSSVSTI